MKPGFFHRGGFTLIELLIVVAIIAILAAIAVPNFLEAQTRARTSRTKADMRSLATAIETYYVDHGTTPVPADETGVTVPPQVATAEGFETYVPVSLTTPIVYINALPEDPFFRTQGELSLFHFTTREYFEDTEGDDAAFDAFLQNVTGSPQPMTRYYVMSHGPDADHDSPDLLENPEGPALYDPTNGTISSGDIIYFQGRGFVK